MARQWVSGAVKVLCVGLVTPFLYFGILLGLLFVYEAMPIALATKAFWSPVTNAVFAALIASATSFLTTRIGRTLPVAIASLFAPFGVLLYTSTVWLEDGRMTITLSPLSALLVFVSSAAGVRVGYRYSRGNVTMIPVR
jgi:hypothetical protein